MPEPRPSGFERCGCGCRPDRKPWPHTLVWGNCALAIRYYDAPNPVIVEEYRTGPDGTELRRRVIVVDDWEETE